MNYAELDIYIKQPDFRIKEIDLPVFAAEWGVSETNPKACVIRGESFSDSPILKEEAKNKGKVTEWL